MQEIFKELKQRVTEKEDKAALMDDSVSYDIKEDNYYQITPWMTTKPIAFVDGGSSCFIESPSLCVGFVRVVSVIMKNKKSRKVLHNEFFVLGQSYNKNGTIHYKTKHFESKNTKNLIGTIDASSLDPGHSTREQRMPISRVVDIARRFAELELAIETINHLDNGDMIVLDGNLKAVYDGEAEILERLYTAAEDRGVLVTAVSKTSNTLTDKGDTLTSKIAKNAKSDEWYYYPAFETKGTSHKAHVYFVKFHKGSNYIFCVDIQKDKMLDMSKVMGVLAFYSTDASFPGYPYGLIKADRLARVAENETDILLTRFYASDPELFEQLRPYMNSINAHSVLDNM